MKTPLVMIDPINGWLKRIDGDETTDVIGFVPGSTFEPEEIELLRVAPVEFEAKFA